MADLVRVKEKFQVTIPVALRKATSLETGDYLEAIQWGDGILLRPATPGKRTKVLKAKPGIVAFLNQRRGTGRARQEIDAQVAGERAAWDA